jgi:hypothetical protein
MSERWFVGEEAARDARRWPQSKPGGYSSISLDCLYISPISPISPPGLAYHLILRFLSPVSSITLVHPILFSIACVFILLLLFIRANCCPAFCPTFLLTLGPLHVHPLILQSICHKPMQALFEALTLPLTLAQPVRSGRLSSVHVLLLPPSLWSARILTLSVNITVSSGVNQLFQPRARSSSPRAICCDCSMPVYIACSALLPCPPCPPCRPRGMRSSVSTFSTFAIHSFPLRKPAFSL